MKLFLAFLLLGAACANQVRFDGFKVFRVQPQTEAQLEAVRAIEEYNLGYDFWTYPTQVNVPVDIMVPPHMFQDFQEFLDLQQLTSQVFIDNVQERIDRERAPKHPRNLGWEDYYDKAEIDAWLNQLQEENPEIVTVLSPGLSYEQREVTGIKISFSENNVNNAVFIEGGIHAREWISPAVVTYIINEILSSTDENVRSLVERYDWYIFPVFNPDGYAYSRETNRMWRKTRVPYGTCYGADPNRNWDYRWNTGGASSNPCSETYAGPNAFSEPEVASMADYISSIQDKLVAYLSFHSYSQLLLLPYGHTPDHLDNYDELKEVGDAAAETIASFFGIQYQVGNTAEILYVATGTSADWVKGTYGTRITYTYELRDTGANGFVLPADQILPSGIETFASVITILREFENL